MLTNRIALFLLIALVGVVIGFATGLILSRVVIRPLAYLRDGVMQLAGQNFNAAVPIQSDDELGDLAKAFNAMAMRLRQARATSRRSVSRRTSSRRWASCRRRWRTRFATPSA